MNTEETGILLRLFHASGVPASLLRRALCAAAEHEITLDLLLTLCTDTQQRLAVLACLSHAGRQHTPEQSRVVDTTLQWSETVGHHLLFANDKHYPPLLRLIPDYPPLLFVKGDISCLKRPMLAIVGSRSSTAYGRSVAYRLSADLADMGLVICSGLASGIDTRAHIAALDTGAATVAVLGNGLNSVYPASNQKLADRIVSHYPSGGALLAEVPLHAGPVAGHFPQRNRIISGMSLGVCVVEATLRSGSLITARLAQEQNREVFAVPGSVNSPGSRGCHKLLTQGAVLTETAEDVAAQIRFICQAQMAMAYPDFSLAENNRRPSQEQSLRESIPDDCQAVYQHLCEDAASVDTLVIRTGLTFPQLSEKLLTLELAGLARHQGNRWWRNY